MGVDFVVTKGEEVFSPFTGKLTIVKPYKANGTVRDNLSGCNIVEGKTVVEIYYFKPFTEINNKIVKEGDLIGYAQAVNEAYTPKMTNHIHLEVQVNGVYKEPISFLKLKKKVIQQT